MAQVGFNYAVCTSHHNLSYYAGIMLDTSTHLANNYAGIIDPGLLNKQPNAVLEISHNTNKCSPLNN